MEEVNFDQDKLCQSLRAVGLKKETTHQLVNTIAKWYNANGAEWTVARLKALHHWYITTQAGKPEPPSWFKRSAKGLPLGIFGSIFKLDNQQRALAALSAHTLFVSKKILPSQEKKFKDSLAGNGCNFVIKKWYKTTPKDIGPWVQSVLSSLDPPMLECITGLSIPINYSTKTLHVKSKEDRILGYALSWESAPKSTLQFLKNVNRTDLIPPAYMSGLPVGEDLTDGFQIVYDKKLKYGPPELRVHHRQWDVAGRVSCIQEPSLKARWIANPNRITQHFLHPLGEVLYKLLETLSTDCTFKQDAGSEWVQSQLRLGKRLSGADLSSATDLLNMDLCLDLVLQRYFGKDLTVETHWESPANQIFKYHIDHFREVARLQWIMGSGEKVMWKQGQPLGTYPSFALLGLAHNAIAERACIDCRLNPSDSFRVIGDDIIMDDKLSRRYLALVKELGGEINLSKTITSQKIGEFAGRIITDSRIMSKRVKFKGLSDDNFFVTVSQLGDQAKALLKPRQLTQYELFKYVPGIVVQGQYPKDSFGHSFANRYLWYLNASQLSHERPKRDKDIITFSQLALLVKMTLADKQENSYADMTRLNRFFPYRAKVADDFQSPDLPVQEKKGRFPSTMGKTMLQVLELASRSPHFRSFDTWLTETRSIEEKMNMLDKQSPSRIPPPAVTGQEDNGVEM